MRKCKFCNVFPVNGTVSDIFTATCPECGRGVAGTSIKEVTQQWNNRMGDAKYEAYRILPAGTAEYFYTSNLDECEAFTAGYEEFGVWDLECDTPVA